jgi:hypothetical protein
LGDLGILQGRIKIGILNEIVGQSLAKQKLSAASAKTAESVFPIQSIGYTIRHLRTNEANPIMRITARKKSTFNLPIFQSLNSTMTCRVELLNCFSFTPPSDLPV